MPSSHSTPPPSDRGPDGDSPRDGSDDGQDAAERRPSADGGTVALDEATLHRVVRDAVEDAILGAIGTVLLVGVGLFLVWTGGAVAWRSLTTGVGTLGEVTGAGLGVAILLGGCYLAGTSLGLLAPMRDWRTRRD